MKPLALLTVPAALLLGGQLLSTRYEAEQTLRVEIETVIAIDTEMSMERDGQPVEGRGGGGGMSSESEYKEVRVDTIVAAEKGKPTKVKRTFEELGGTRSASFGEESRDSDVESPLEGVTVLLSGEGDDVEVEVVEGTKPEDDKAFDHQRVELFLDGALPAKEVEEGATWELSKEAVLSILALDTHRGLFPPPPREEGGERGGGRRGGGRMGGGGGDLGLLASFEWKGTAKLASAKEDVDGVDCAMIELELTASGELPMPEPRAPRGERMLAPESTALGNSYDVTLEGKLAFDLAAKRPRSLEVSGKLSNTIDMEREGRDGGTMRIHTKRSGTYKLSVKVTQETAEKKKD